MSEQTNQFAVTHLPFQDQFLLIFVGFHWVFVEFLRYLNLRDIVKLRSMGIHGLAKLIADYAPSAIKENEIKNYFGRLID